MHRTGVGGVVRADNRNVAGIRERDLADVGLRIAVAKEEIGWEYADRHLDLQENPDRFSVGEEILINRLAGYVVSGDVDVFLADSLTCHQVCEASNGVLVDRLRGKPLYVNDCGVLLPRRQHSLLSWLEEEFADARQYPEIQRMEQEILNRLEGIVVATGAFRVPRKVAAQQAHATDGATRRR